MKTLTYCTATLCIAPVVVVLLLALMPGEGVFAIISTQLSSFVTNSILLALGVGLLASAVGTQAAWYVTMYDFPCRRIIDWALLLPLAMPAYVLAMVYGHWLDAAGPVQTALRNASGFGYHEYWFPDIRSPVGVILVLSLSLYPYVYVLARNAFRHQRMSLFDAARLLGMPPQQWLWRIAMPVARPALVMGAALVMMETLADFGTVSLYGVPTFTTGIYQAWYGLGDPYGAAKLAAMLLAFVLLVTGLERYSRRHMRTSQSPNVRRLTLQSSRWRSYYHCVACLIPVLFGFVLPVLQLVVWAGVNPAGWLDTLHWQAAGYALLIAVLVALITTAIAMLFAYRLRAKPAAWVKQWLRFACIGYAIPGSVIAVAIFIPLLLLDRQIADAGEAMFGERPGLMITGSIAAIVIACTIRFLAVAFGSVETGLSQISTRVDDASRLLGTTGFPLIRELHWPTLKSSVIVGGFMVFADTLKELPATYLLRQFEVNTLAIRAYELAGDGRLIEASIPALMLVGIGLLAVAVLAGYRFESRSLISKRMNALQGG